MRIDKYLKLTRLIKRRTVAKELLDRGIFTINGRVAKPSSEVNEGDIVVLPLGRHKLTIKVVRLASYTKKGELLRVMYNTPDFRQFLDFFHTGVKINDSCIIYLHEDQNNRYNQYYTESTNVLNTEIENTYFNLHVKQVDFVSMKNSILIKRH